MIVIEGAGIAGLTLANCLKKLNREYLIVEKAPVLQPVGAGIAVQNNGIAILQALGLEDKLHGCELQKMEMFSQFQEQTLDPSIGWHTKMVHRRALQQVLLDGLAERDIRLNCTVTKAVEQDQGVEICLSTGEQIKAELLIVASGIHADRHQAAEIEQANQWCWRAVVSSQHKQTTGGEYWFGDYRLGVMPIGNQEYYIYQVLKNGGQQDERERLEFWQSDKVKAMFPWLDISNAKWLSHPLAQRQIHWGQGRIIAIGDAAHALTPNMGQGAVLAMEDAYQLAMLLMHKNEDQLLSALIQARHERVAKVQSQSLFIGKLAHWQNPLAVRLRDFLFNQVSAKSIVNKQIIWMQQFIDQMQPLIPTTNSEHGR